MSNRILITYLLFLLGCFSSVNLHATPQQNANSLVAGILSYTNWTTQLTHLNFCLIDGPATFITPAFFQHPSPLIRPNDIRIIELSSSQIILKPIIIHEAGCNILYFADTTEKAQQNIINHINYPALSIAEQNTDCAIGSAFCLYRMAHRYNFKVNLMSLKKSNIRVNSKVLMLANLEGLPK